MKQRAKVFWSGRSQAVRLPAEYRFDTSEVYIRRDETTGDVILSKKAADWTKIFAALDAADLPDDFMKDRDQGLPQKRKL